MARHGAGHLVPGGTAEIPRARDHAAARARHRRLVFRALNVAEAVLAALLVVVGAAVGLPGAAWLLVVALIAVLCAQVLLLRPRLDRRAAQILAGDPPPPSRQHLAYVVLEGRKVLALPSLGAVIAFSLLP